MNRLKGSSICICLSAVLALHVTVRADSFSLTDAKDPVKGEILKETVKGITVNSGGATRNVARAQIVPDSMVYENEPAQLRDAREALREKQFTRAHRGYQAVIDLVRAATGGAEKAGAKAGGKKAAPKAGKGAGTIRPIFLQHAFWGQVQTYREEGNAAGAMAAVDDLLGAIPDSWYIQDALVLKVRLAMESGGEAAKAAEEAIKLAEAAGAGTEVAESIKLLQAESLKKQGKIDEAVKIWQALARSTVKTVAERAKLGIAQAQLAKGEAVQAKMGFNDLMRSSRDRATLCGAACGLGTSQLREIAGKETADGLREALESFLRADVLYFPAQGDPTEDHQIALLSAAECAEKLLKIVDKKNVKAQEGHRTVARDLYRKIQTTYPRSEAAKKAATALGKLSAGAAN